MKLDTIKILLLVIIVLISLLAWKWNKKPIVETKYVDKIVKVDTNITYEVTDTFYKDRIVSYPVYVGDTTINVINENIDTLKIIADYYKTKVFYDVLVVGNTGYISLTDYVRKNSIFKRETSFNLVTAKEMLTITKYKPYEVKIFKGGMYLGGSVVLSNTNWNLFISATYVTPQRGLYEVGYDPFNKAVLGGAKIKLW